MRGLGRAWEENMMIVRTSLTLLVGYAAVLLLGGRASMAADPAPRHASVASRPFGKTAEGADVTQYVLTNNQGSSCSVIDFGAIVTNLLVPDKNGTLGDIVLGFDTPQGYQNAGPFMGCIAGRYANRIANGMFTLDGHTYALTMNQGTNTLHGGFKGLAKRMWKADTGMTPDGPTVRLTILDPDGAEGWPGNLTVTVLYTLTNTNWLKVQYFATTDKATPINLTHHSYFNLGGEGKNDVLGYVAKLNAAHYLPVDDNLIPTGDVAAVAGTPFDFTRAKLIGHDIQSLPGTPPGYDHAMVLDSDNGSLARAATIYDPGSGRQLECWTTEPAMHFFTANNLAGVVGKNGETYAPYRAFCLETQHYPDSPNHAKFPNTILRPGDTYRQLTEFRLSVPKTPLKEGD
jgi:aldose 1-epimerase